MYEMWRVSNGIVIIILLILSLLDIRWRKIPVRILLILSILIMSYQVYYQNVEWGLVAGGIGIGMLFLLISRKTGESIGYADSWLILLLGIYQGFWGILGTLTGAMFVLGVVSLVVVVLKQMSRKCVLPFIPFLTTGYVLWMLSEI